MYEPPCPPQGPETNQEQKVYPMLNWTLELVWGEASVGGIIAMLDIVAAKDPRVVRVDLKSMFEAVVT